MEPVELPDDVHAVAVEEARRAGITVTEWLTRVIEARCGIVVAPLGDENDGGWGFLARSLEGVAA